MWKCQSLSCVQCIVTPGTVARQAPLSMGLPRQEPWRGQPYPLPGNLPSPGIELTSPVPPALQAESLPSEPPGCGGQDTSYELSNVLWHPSPIASSIILSSYDGKWYVMALKNTFLGDTRSKREPLNFKMVELPPAQFSGKLSEAEHLTLVYCITYVK